MKIKIKFDEHDCSDLDKVSFDGACGTIEELACTLMTLVGTTEYNFEAVVATMLSEYCLGESTWLDKACAQWLGSEKLDTPAAQE